ncbi:MAG: hypothetical protein QM638_15090 [Nocardioides sp.]|uniref:hypothetical protein n=1 Tax=Nocardioides sp. TaxID=35761 RepID=UPI0039E60769
MTASFPEIPDLKALAALLGVEIDPETKQEAVLNLLLSAPGADEYLRTKYEVPSSPPGTLGMLVGKTRIFFNLERCKQLKGDAMTALAVYATTQSAPVAFFAASARKLYDNLLLLTEDEVEVVRSFFSLSNGKPYDNPVAEQALRAKFAGTAIALDDLLDGLERKGVVSKRRGGSLILVY